MARKSKNKDFKKYLKFIIPTVIVILIIILFVSYQQNYSSTGGKEEKKSPWSNLFEQDSSCKYNNGENCENSPSKCICKSNQICSPDRTKSDNLGCYTISCGDGTCSAEETVESCPADCNISAPVCGDGVCDAGENQINCPADCGGGTVCHQNVSIANWNLQIFGTTKAANDTLLNIYASIIDDYDIVFVQEIRDASGTAFPKLCAKLPDYQCQNSSRAGRSTSKEQYGIIYKDGISIIELTDFNPDAQDRWERPPVKVTFNTSCYQITAYNIHTKPDDVPQELTALQGVVIDSGNVAVLGNLNADCTYYNHATETQFSSWHWIIPDDADTTVAATDCAYDRIILNDDAYGEYDSHGIITSGITSAESDHYLVWVKFVI